MTARSGRRLERQRAYRRGRRAEWIAGCWLRLKGYRILARDYRCPVGEIDLIARRGALLVFVEVKRRDRLDTAAEAISQRQRRRVTRAAQAFLQAHPQLGHLDQRFDALLLAPVLERPWGPWLRHQKDAWQSDTSLPY